jgi:hypothetical protein
MNKKYPTFFLTWFNKFSRVPSPGIHEDRGRSGIGANYHRPYVHENNLMQPPLLH